MKTTPTYHATNPTNNSTLLRNRTLQIIFIDRKEIYRGSTRPVKDALRLRALGKGGAV